MLMAGFTGRCGRPPREEAPLYSGAAGPSADPQAPGQAARHRGGALINQGLRPLAPVGLLAPGAFRCPAYEQRPDTGQRLREAEQLSRRGKQCGTGISFATKSHGSLCPPEKQRVGYAFKAKRINLQFPSQKQTCYYIHSASRILGTLVSNP